MKTIQVLDNGYVTLIESWGSDERIVEAARMSTGKGFLGWYRCDHCGEYDARQGTCAVHSAGLHANMAADAKLLRFLWENKHATPFEMAGATFEIKAPIMVFREWHRHRTQSYNEMSARYVPLPDENYVPSLDRLLQVNAGTANKQASGTGVALEASAAASWLADLADVYERAQRVYERGLQLGVAKELARLPVPVARYSRMRASANLRNWLAFEALRLPATAQWEIRCYAGAIADVLRQSFPRTMELFDGSR